MTIFQIDKQIDLLQVNINSLHRRIAKYESDIAKLQALRQTRMESEELMTSIETRSMSVGELIEFIKQKEGVTHGH